VKKAQFPEGLHVSEDKCPQCDKQPLRGWDELSDEEQEVVRRLPGSADYPLALRRARHRWCSNCWFEARDDQVRA